MPTLRLRSGQALNRQISMIGLDSTAEYVYDALGRRVAKIVDGVTTYYVYNAEYQVLEERDGSNQLLARYTYGAGIDEPLTMERGGAAYTYHRDALGSVTEITNASGELIEAYEYDVYGSASIFDSSGMPLSASAIGNPYLFTARRYDPESGNYYYRARIYSPTQGRFLQSDPLGYVDGLNLYAYVLNNPVRWLDPSGLFADGGLITVPLGYWLLGGAMALALSPPGQEALGDFAEHVVDAGANMLDRIEDVFAPRPGTAPLVQPVPGPTPGPVCDVPPVYAPPTILPGPMPTAAPVPLPVPMTSYPPHRRPPNTPPGPKTTPIRTPYIQPTYGGPVKTPKPLRTDCDGLWDVIHDPNASAAKILAATIMYYAADCDEL